MGENQGGEKKNNGEKKSEAITVVLMFDMHCEGCAKKVRKSIKKFQGVENVQTDCSTNKLMITGQVDPIKIKEKVEEKIKKKVELVSPQPNKAAKEDNGGGSGGEKKSGDKKPEEKKKADDKKPAEKKKADDKKPEEKKESGKSEDKNEKTKELPIATVQLKTKVHCDGCASKIKKIVTKCQGVQDANVDLQKDLVVVKGTMDIKEILPYLNVKLKRPVDLVPAKKDDGAGEDKKPKEGGGGGGGDGGKSAEKLNEGGEGGGSAEKPKGSGGKKKEGAGDKKDNGGEKEDGGGRGGEGSTSKDLNVTRFEVNKMEYNPYSYDYGYSQTYDPRQQGEGYGQHVVEQWHTPYESYDSYYSHPPQMFSDENPNACSIM